MIAHGNALGSSLKEIPSPERAAEVSPIGASARGYSNKVMGDTNLCLVLLNGDDLLAIEKNPAAIVDVFRREAVHAMRLKTLEL